MIERCRSCKRMTYEPEFGWCATCGYEEHPSKLFSILLLAFLVSIGAIFLYVFFSLYT